MRFAYVPAAIVLRVVVEAHGGASVREVARSLIMT
jgi:hypothetical protein